MLVRANDSKLWNYSIYQLSSYRRASSTRLRSPPTSPIPSMLHRFVKPPSIAAPRPQRVVNAVPNLMPYAYRSGLGPDYQIEHFQFPGRTQPQGQQGQIQRPPLAAAGAGPSNLYPDFLRSSLLPSAPASRRTSSALPGGTAPPQQTTIQVSGSPPPLGDWPRSDIMQAPQGSKRSTRRITSNVVSPLTTQNPQNYDVDDTLSQGVMGGPGGEVTMSISRSKKPFGPRTRSGSNSGGANRPPPLDLSNISSLRPNR